jgi:hypothetical protein
MNNNQTQAVRNETTTMIMMTKMHPQRRPVWWTFLQVVLVVLCCWVQVCTGEDRIGLPNSNNGGGSGDPDEQVGDGVTEFKDVMDNCTGAAGPRPINGVPSPGRTLNATVDDVNGGFCGVDIDSPGIWWT